MLHELKVSPKYFVDLFEDKKKCEVRANDRDYAVTDFIALNEWDGVYTGRCALFQISHIIDDDKLCKEGFVILSIEPCVIQNRSHPFRKEPDYLATEIAVYSRNI